MGVNCGPEILRPHRTRARFRTHRSRRAARNSVAAKLKSAAGSYGSMPETPLLLNYLDQDGRRAFVDSMAEVKVKQGEVIMRDGDKGNNFYVIKEGSCDVVVPDQNAGKKVRTIEAGGSCGELSLLTGKPRSATITATSSELVLLMMNRKMFNNMIGVEVAKKRTAWVPFLQEKVPMLAELSDYEFMLVADAIQTLTFEAGQPICKAGEAKGNDLFYIVKSGEVKGERAFGPGDFFGHVEILQQSANQTTRTASGRVELATLASDAFKALVPLHALVRDGNQQQFALKQAAADGGGGGGGGKQRRHGQAAEASAAMMKGGAAAGGSIKVGKAKSAEAVKRIMGAVKSNIIFSRLNETQLQMLQGAMNEHHVAAGSNVITQGEKGNHFYVVDSGDLDAFVTSSDAGAEPRYVKSFGVGDSFGELALMYNCPRTATIQARTDVVLWSLDRVSFRMIVLEANTKKASMYETFLEKVQLLEPLSKDQRNKMVDALEEVSLKDGDKIIKEGEEGERPRPSPRHGRSHPATVSPRLTLQPHTSQAPTSTSSSRARS